MKILTVWLCKFMTTHQHLQVYTTFNFIIFYLYTLESLLVATKHRYTFTRNLNNFQIQIFLPFWFSFVTCHMLITTPSQAVAENSSCQALIHIVLYSTMYNGSTLLLPSPRTTPQVDYSFSDYMPTTLFSVKRIFASHRHSERQTYTIHAIYNPHQKLYIYFMWLPVYDNKFLEYTQSTHQHRVSLLNECAKL